jgi:RecB family exonuclease
MEIARTTRSSPGHVVHYRPERISYSGLALYEACPYRYYVTGVARLGSRSPDGTGNAEAVALGNAVHAVLRTAVEFELPSQERVHEICRTAGLPATAESEVARLAGEFLGSETALRAAGSSRVAREMPFAVPLGDTLLDGALDMIAWEGDSALIVDYKTGGADRQIDAEAYRTQAECYAVAAFAMGASLVEVRFVALRQACQATVFEYGIGDAGALRAKIESRIESLRHGEYEPLRRYDPFACPECPVLGNLCPVSAPGRKPAV